MRVFKLEGTKVRDQCIRSHRLWAFLAVFPTFSFSYASSMSKINIIDCKTEEKTEAYVFAPSMFSENSLSGNQSVFEDLNVVQMGIDKMNSQWDNLQTIWWGNQKTEAQMLKMQRNGI